MSLAIPLGRELEVPDALLDSLVDRAGILMAQGELHDAMPLLHEAERICRELGATQRLALMLANQGAVLEGGGRPGLARSLFEEAHQVATTHGHADLAEQMESRLRNLR